jgi:sulfate transport system permease protein
MPASGAPTRRGRGGTRGRRLGLRAVALGYLAALLAIPVGMIAYRTFQHGIGPVAGTLTSDTFVHALKLTLLMVAVAVPANTIFGIVCALVLVRGRSRIRWLLDMLIDLPFAVSPVVVGLSLFLLYGRTGWLGSWLTDRGIQVLFSTPGMVLATIFVSLPFVVREVAPLLREVGTSQEEAAATLGASPWQAFWRVTLPAIRWGVIYGVVLSTARALGEFGAVSVVSGKLIGQTETLPLFVQNRFENFDLTGAYTASFALAAIALATLVAMTKLRPREAAT